MATKDQIKAALSQLDPANPDHWTDDGLPVTRVVQTFADDASIKRSDINDAAPQFTRDSVTQPADLPASLDEPEETVAGTKLSADAIVTAIKATPASVNPDGLSDDEWKAALQAELAKATTALEDARKVTRAAQDAEQKAIKAKDVAQAKLTQSFPPLSHAENIKQYLESENAKRAAKFGVAGHYGQSSIDAALSGRRGRGFGNGTMRGKVDPRFQQKVGA